MKIIHGFERTVVLVGPLAIKIINLRLISKRALKLLRNMLTFSLRNVYYDVRFIMACLVQLQSFIQTNWDEYLTWRYTKAEFLAPTYLSIGLINVMRRSTGVPLTDEEARSVRDKIQSKTGRYVSSHAFERGQNYLKIDRGVILVDYGCRKKGTDSIRFILTWWREEVGEILSSL